MNQEVLVLSLAWPLIYDGCLCDATTHWQAEHSSNSVFAEPNSTIWKHLGISLNFLVLFQMLDIRKIEPVRPWGRHSFLWTSCLPSLWNTQQVALPPHSLCVLCSMLFNKEHLDKKEGQNYFLKMGRNKGSGGSCSKDFNLRPRREWPTRNSVYFPQDTTAI